MHSDFESFNVIYKWLYFWSEKSLNLQKLNRKIKKMTLERLRSIFYIWHIYPYAN